MLDSIHIGVTGLLGYQQGLRVIANNTANLNTPGYKSSTLQFTDLFYANAGSTPAGGAQLGYGLGTTGTRIDFAPGDLRQTGNDLDLALEGEGMFTLRDAQGQTRYTRAGEFQFDAAGVLVDRNDSSKVMAMDASGKLAELSLQGLHVGAAHATSVAHFTGNLSSTTTDQTVGAIKVFDARGGEHELTLHLTSNDAVKPGSWTLELLDGAQSIGTSEIDFTDGHPTADTSKPSFTYTPAGGAPQQIVLDFSADVTTFASGDLSTLAMTSQDGYAPGTLTKTAFDATGTLVLTYSNGQTSKGPRLALARFTTPDAVEELGGSEFGEAHGLHWQAGMAGSAGFGSVRSGMLEMSNVDLSREFSDLVIMQRGFQAASQVVSTANDMLQELFGIKQK